MCVGRGITIVDLKDILSAVFAHTKVKLMLSFRTQRIQTVTRYIKTHIQNDPDFGSCLLITHLNLIFPLAFPFVSRPPKRPISFLLIVRIPNRPLVVRRRVTVNPVGTTGVILSSAQRRKRRRKKTPGGHSVKGRRTTVQN